jgi:hypothetical protein
MIRGWRTYILIVIYTIVWIILMEVLPKYESKSSPLIFPGLIILAFLIAVRITSLELENKAPNVIGAGIKFTLATPNPLLTLKMPELVNATAFKDYNFYALNGIPLAGMAGGKLEGHSIIPSYLDIDIAGQHLFNFVWTVYRKTPNLARGEKPLDNIPTPLLDALRTLETWDEESPVFFGRIPYLKIQQVEFEIKNINLQDELDTAWAMNKAQKDLITGLRTTITEQAEIIRDVGTKTNIGQQFNNNRPPGEFMKQDYNEGGR